MIATIASILQLISIIIQVFFLFRDKLKDNFSHFILLGSGILLLANLLVRSIQINFIAITNVYESLVFFSGMIVILTFFLRIKIKNKLVSPIIFGLSMISISLLAIASSPLVSSEVLEPIPALQSNWLVLHVSFSFIGEAFFALSFISAIYYLLTGNEEKKKALDKITYTAIVIGYPIYTAGALIFGAIWASYSWGRFWSWDPKETWALITWLTYSVYLHLRFIRKMRKTPAAWVAIIGFAFTIFTFFGVNYLLSGLHSYN